MSRIKTIFFLCLSIFSLTTGLRGNDRPPPSFPVWNPEHLAAEKLCKICHGKDTTGNQFAVWSASAHANAFAVLGSDKARAVGAKLGVTDPQKDGRCLQCHSTAYGFTQKPVTDKVRVEEGVTCQTCHGPGDRYKAKEKHAGKREEAVANHGMIVPTEANICSRCHNQDNPTYNPDRYVRPDGTKVDFDFPQAYEKIKHPVKK